MAGKLKALFSEFFKSLHQLWLEVSGTIFIVFGIAFGFHAIQEYRKQAVTQMGWRYGVTALFSVLTLGFGIHSFWKARKLR